ncbi:Myb-like_DNA-binding domain-containing protein [Hexamita inflata]|uniref:Myb-like DNA-binding domain-containing protein n=1 Tax=Hexamita inflata TaxID=28002 RepID=A0AA86R341_9EUKA|nr:Myb-like DNA-binding domain-containing protein [Hexamita inflata]
MQIVLCSSYQIMYLQKVQFIMVHILVGQLLGCVQIYGLKWSLIKKLQFPDCTTEQLRQKYYAFVKFTDGNKLLFTLIQQGNIQAEDHTRVKKLYEHFLELKDLYEKCDSADMLYKKALIKVNEDIQLKELVQYMEAVMQQYAIQ